MTVEPASWGPIPYLTNLRELKRQLQVEGFTKTLVWEDGPAVFYADHTHPVETAYVILEGEMTLTVEDRTRAYRAGGALIRLSAELKPS